MFRQARHTVEIEILGDLNPENYPSDVNTVEEMLEYERKQLEHDPLTFIDICADSISGFKTNVELVPDD